MTSAPLDLAKRLRERADRKEHDGFARDVALLREAATSLEDHARMLANFAKAIVHGDEPFGGEEWEALLCEAEAIDKAASTAHGKEEG